MDDGGYFVVRPSPTADPDGAMLRGVLQAQAAIDRARSLRGASLHLLAAASLPLAFLAAGPERSSAGFRSATLTSWTICFGGLAIAGFVEWKYRRKRASLASKLRSPPHRAR